MRKPRLPARTTAQRIREVSDAVLVQTVIAEHPSEGPHDDFRTTFRVQMQHVSEVAHLVGHVAGLPDQRFTVDRDARPQHKSRAGFC